jgi:hypothetical protein
MPFDNGCAPPRQGRFFAPLNWMPLSKFPFQSYNLIALKIKTTREKIK